MTGQAESRSKKKEARKTEASEVRSTVTVIDLRMHDARFADSPFRKQSIGVFVPAS